MSKSSQAKCRANEFECSMQLDEFSNKPGLMAKHLWQPEARKIEAEGSLELQKNFPHFSFEIVF